MMTNADAEAHLSRLCRLRKLYHEKKAELRVEERRASPSLRDLRRIEKEHFLLKLVFERLCRDTNYFEIPVHIREKHLRS